MQQPSVMLFFFFFLHYLSFYELGNEDFELARHQKTCIVAVDVYACVCACGVGESSCLKRRQRAWGYLSMATTLAVWWMFVSLILSALLYLCLLLTFLLAPYLNSLFGYVTKINPILIPGCNIQYVQLLNSYVLVWLRSCVRLLFRWETSFLPSSLYPSFLCMYSTVNIQIGHLCGLQEQSNRV